MDRRVHTAIAIIVESVDQPRLVANITEAVHLSPSHLRRLFLRETGLTLSQYAKELRMAEACRLLRTTFLSVKEIAARSGAGDLSHFVRSFEKTHGLSPSRYRRHIADSIRTAPEMAETANESSFWPTQFTRPRER
jgi:AraC-like DNA-binding protein